MSYVHLVYNDYQHQRLMKYILAPLLLIFISCTSTKQSSYMSRDMADCREQLITMDSSSIDSTYGYSINNPVKLGEGPQGERYYMSRLIGPNKQGLVIGRRGSIRGDSGPMIDAYTFRLVGDTADRTLYLNMYECDNPKAPHNLLIKPSLQETEK